MHVIVGAGPASDADMPAYPASMNWYFSLTEAPS
jgi:hypothetical protein